MRRFEALTAGRPRFIGLSTAQLAGDFATRLPRKRVVIELLEAREPDEDVFAACRLMMRRGHPLSLAEFFDEPEDQQALLDLTDYIKIDFASTDETKREDIAREMLSRHIHLAADNVRTMREFDKASAAGYRYFQGPFLVSPNMTAEADVTDFQADCLRLLRQLNRPELDIAQVGRAMREQPSIAGRTLQAINAAMGLGSDVTSLQQALVLLGPDRMRMWACVGGIAALGRHKPADLVATSVRRARFCELLAQAARLKVPDSEPFLLGLFAMVDVLAGRPKDELLDDMGVSQNIRRGLIDTDNTFSRLLDCVIGSEVGDWDTCEPAMAALGLSAAQVSESQVEAALFAKQAFRG